MLEQVTLTSTLILDPQTLISHMTIWIAMELNPILENVSMLKIPHVGHMKASGSPVTQMIHQV